MSRDAAINIYAGRTALAHIRDRGLCAGDVSAVVAAAGGPKGLSMIPLDQWLFGQWMPSQAPLFVAQRQLLGASIGAWRMAAASRNDPSVALSRLSEGYLELQRYSLKPSNDEVANTCRQVVQHMMGSANQFVTNQHPDFQLQVVTARTKQHAQYKPMFIKAAVLNTVNRQYLGRYLQRHVWHNPEHTPPNLFDDALTTTLQPFGVDNVEDALLASGSIPLVAQPVVNVKHAPAGAYWDGGLTDYHLYLPYNRLPGLVLYPHFSHQVTAGWLDKSLPWRKHGVGRRGQTWLDNLLLIAPSKAFMAGLAQQKLPDRQDFYRYGSRHDERISYWRALMQQCESIASDFAQFVDKPQRFTIHPLPH